MKIDRIIGAGDKITLKFRELSSTTVVYDLQPPLLFLAAPPDELELVQGSKVDINLTSSFQLFTVEGSIEKINRDGDLPTIEVRLMGDALRIQRRENVRIPERLPVRLITTDRDRRKVAARLVDLSAGGASIEADVALDLGSDLRMEFYLPSDLNIFDLECEVVRSPRLIRKFPEKYNVGVAFKSVHKLDSERIIKYIFEKQRELQRMRRTSK